MLTQLRILSILLALPLAVFGQAGVTYHPTTRNTNPTNTNYRANQYQAEYLKGNGGGGGSMLVANPNSGVIEPKTLIILDTDVGGDPDDAGDIALANALHNAGEFEMIGACAAVTNWWSPVIIEQINAYYGNPHIPVGRLRKDTGGLLQTDHYGSFVATNFFSVGRHATNYLAHTNFYRTLLASAPDWSVKIITTGPLYNIYDLYHSAADGISPLTGAELIGKKVKEFIIVAGQFPFADPAEFNVNLCPCCYAVFHSITNPITWVGIEVGATVRTGNNYQNRLATNNPARSSFLVGLDALGAGETNRAAWAQIGILYAARGTNYFGSNYWTYVNTGTNQMVDCTTIATNRWVTGPVRNQKYLVQSLNTNVLATLIDDIWMKPPPLKPSGSNDAAGLLSGRRLFLHELTSAPTPATNTVVVYGKDTSGKTQLYYKDDTGTEVGPLGAGGGTNTSITLASASSAGATSIELTLVPSNVTAQSAYMVIDPYSTNAETRRISSISGTTITPVVQKSGTYKRVQFISSTKTIQQRRSISAISGDGTTVTVDTSAAHNLITGDTIYIWGTTNFNNSLTGPHAITVTDADTFTYLAAINTNDFATGYAIHSADVNALAQLFNTQTIIISGSASNNGTFTVATVDQQAGDGIGAGSAITVNETITNDVSGLTNTIVINLNKAHVAGAPVLFLPGGAINVRYYGAVADNSAGSASRNRLAIQRAIDDAYYQEVYSVYIPGGKVYYVDGEIQLEREQNFGGDRENVSAIRATGITFTTNTYLLHGRRDGCIQNVQVGTYKQRYYIHDLSLLGAGIASGNGFGFNLQQPCSIDRIRVDGFRARGISIGGQEASFNNIMVTDCGGTNGAPPIWLNGMSFSYWNALNVEQTGSGATGVVWITSGGGTSAKNNTFINTHFEHTAGSTNVTFQVQDAFQTIFINTHDSIQPGSTTFRFNELAGQTPRALTYQIIGAEATGNQSETNTYAIDDVNRGDKIHWDRAEQRSFKAYIENYVAGPHNFSTPSANADGAFPICLPGLGSRELFLGSGNDDGSGVPIIRSILGADTEFHWKAYNATTNVVFSVGNGGVTNAGWSTVGGAVTNKNTLRVSGISTLETNLDLKALASSSTPPTNHVRVYAKDGPDHSALAWKDDDGNETAINLGTPTAGQVLTFHDANTITNGTAAGGGLGYTITLASIAINPADSTTYYVGADISNSPLTSYAYEKVEVPKNGTIKRVFMKMIYGGAASGETVSHYIRINDTTDVAQIDAVYNADFDYNNTSVSTAVTAGQYIAFKIVTPAWVTNPTNVRYYILVYIE